MHSHLAVVSAAVAIAAAVVVFAARVLSNVAP